MASPDTLQILALVVVPVCSAGAAFGGVKTALNGTRDAVRRIERAVDDHRTETAARLQRIEDDVQDVRERTVRLETLAR